MITPSIRIDRLVETDVGRCVAADDRAGAFDGDFGAQLGACAVDALPLVQPVAIRGSRGQVEAAAACVAGCASALDHRHDEIRT